MTASNNNRFAALLLFQFRVETGGGSNRRRTCEKRLLLLRTANARAALRLAKQRGRQAQHRYRNDAGGVVHFEFVGVLDLLHLGIECEPDEVWYDICEMLEPMERRDRILPPEESLQAFTEEGERRHARRSGRPAARTAVVQGSRIDPE
jgi:hypothetical protein